ncbi:unnamed protein product [Sphenostylis stenocarpa]|uniref:Uncharacterized protein n=1 Tax=Sphenostylis stenocarpa TaxID=92480 RepID=A0AA86VGF4_9FABA|nr:unnamed protein product [Sphenostylis stenocarpa]
MAERDSKPKDSISGCAIVGFHHSPVAVSDLVSLVSKDCLLLDLVEIGYNMVIPFGLSSYILWWSPVNLEGKRDIFFCLPIAEISFLSGCGIVGKIGRLLDFLCWNYWFKVLEKDVKSPNIFERAKEEFEAVFHHDKSPRHDKETHGTSHDIDEKTPTYEVKGPNVFERVKEEIEAVVEAIHHNKESESGTPKRGG